MQQTAGPRSTSTPHGFDRDRLVAVIDPIVRAHGAELHDLELKNENGWVLRIYVEKLGAQELRMSTKQAAVDLDLCASIARDLSPALDVTDPFPHRYSLEVSSPGIERSLKKESDFVRFAGEKAKLKLLKGVGGQKVLLGTLGPVKDGAVSLQDGGREHQVPLADVVAARLVFELGPAGRPGGPQSKRGKKKRK